MDASVPRPGLCCTQVSFCSAELLQVFVFATNNLPQSPFVGHSGGKRAERETSTVQQDPRVHFRIKHDSVLLPSCPVRIFNNYKKLKSPIKHMQKNPDCICWHQWEMIQNLMIF